MPKTKLDTIFESFCQADASTSRCFGGTGLGTSIARQLVELMNGSISVQSVVGKGSTFSFEIALELAQADGMSYQHAPAKTKEVEVPRRVGRILLAEDYPTNQALLKVILEGAGHHLTVVENGRDAVAACDVEDFDLILMDLQMPLMDGNEATRTIRASEGRNSRIPIVALTASADEGTERDCLHDGMDSVLTKPFRREMLLAAVNQWFSEDHRTLTLEASGPMSPPADAPGIDSADELPINFNDALRSFAGNREVLIRVLDQFRRNVMSEVNSIRDALAANDLQRFTRLLTKSRAAREQSRSCLSRKQRGMWNSLPKNSGRMDCRRPSTRL